MECGQRSQQQGGEECEGRFHGGPKQACSSREEFFDDLPMHVHEPPVAAKARKLFVDRFGVVMDVARGRA
jgi:hypothetical protein